MAFLSGIFNKQPQPAAVPAPQPAAAQAPTAAPANPSAAAQMTSPSNPNADPATMLKPLDSLNDCYFQANILAISAVRLPLFNLR